MAELSTRQHGGSQPMSISPAGPTARRADNQNVSAFERMLSLAGGSGLLACLAKLFLGGKVRHGDHSSG